MTFKVKITLYTTEQGRGCRVFYKEIYAENEEQACDFAHQMLEGFIAENITVDTKIVL